EIRPYSGKCDCQTPCRIRAGPHAGRECDRVTFQCPNFGPWVSLSGGLLLQNCLSHAVDVLENRLGDLRISDLQTKILVQRDDKLQGIDRIQTQTTRTE